jgi:hypothetical protein
MANGVERESELVVIFSDEELREVSGVKRGLDYIEVTCGCTSHRYGDAVGRLRVFQNGDLEITCECTPGCQEGLSLSLSSRLLFLFFGKWVLIFMHVGCVLCVCVYTVCGELGLTLICVTFFYLICFGIRVYGDGELCKHFVFLCVTQFKCMLFCLSEWVLFHAVDRIMQLCSLDISTLIWSRSD